jgi:hypothetical protein
VRSVVSTMPPHARTSALDATTMTLLEMLAQFIITLLQACCLPLFACCRARCLFQEFAVCASQHSHACTCSLCPVHHHIISNMHCCLSGCSVYDAPRASRSCTCCGAWSQTAECLLPAAVDMEKAETLAQQAEDLPQQAEEAGDRPRDHDREAAGHVCRS